MSDTPRPAETRPSRSAHRRRIIRLAAIAALPALGIWFAWYLWSVRGYRAAEGIYLADGGQSFIQIKARPLGRLEVAEGRIVPTRMPYWLLDPSVSELSSVHAKARFRHGTLFITQHERFPRDVGAAVRDLSLELKANPERNWDLVGCESIVRLSVGLRDIATKFSKSPPKSSSGKSSWQRMPLLAYAFLRKPMAHYKLPVSKPPIPSFFHRLDDKRLPLYFEMRRQNETPESCLKLIQTICADHPDDRFLTLHLVELEAAAGDLNKARTLYRKWQKEHTTDAGPILSAVADRAWQAIQRTEWVHKYAAFPPYPQIFPDPDLPPPPFPTAYNPGLEGHMQILHDRAQTPMLRFKPNPIVLTNDDIHRGMDDVNYLNYLQIQVTVKSAGVMASFELLKENRKDALPLLIGAYRLGQDLNADSELLLSRLIGIAIRTFACREFAILALNALTTEQELAQFIDCLDELAATPDQTTPANVMLGEWMPLEAYMEQQKFLGAVNVEEVVLRQRLADARMALLRAATRARLQYLRHGVLPTSRRELTDLFEGDPPRDPFAPKLTIACAPTSEGCVVYSLGPDGIDQRGAIEYDQAKGITTPSGDILLHVRRTPEYPFPSNGLRATRASDVLKVFPNGLPLDPFHNTSRGKRRDTSRLAILDATTSTPVTVMSIGPDLKTASPPTPAKWTSTVVVQPVLKRAFTDPIPPDAYRLQPAYDPTNGATSAGDLFLEIPRN